jgi:asparagine synthase (glutamine-hydrolysing)
MCGIAGFLTAGFRDESVMTNVATTMADTMRHRGPDGEGVWVNPRQGIALGHRRLAIQDLSPQGRQPMQSRSGRYWITYNGEVYNFTQLHRELSELGCQFRGHSDTEVLLGAIDMWGLEAALGRFVGMFAFGLWDQEEQQLYLVRDRLGEKPLYFGWLKENFLFASELKALRVFPGWYADVDRDALALHMQYGYIPAPFSIYKGIYKLPAGTFLTIRAGQNMASCRFSPYADVHTVHNLFPESYWSMKAVANEGLLRAIKSETEAIATLDQLLHEAVRGQMIADVPLGAFLSGGIDSSTVVAVMQSESHSPVRTFTIGFHEQDYDEAKYARKIAAHLGTQHTELYVTPADALAMVPELVAIYDEPFSDASQIPTCIVSKMARQQVTVCLSGDGGDELFAGYNRYYWVERFYRLTRFLPMGLCRMASTILSTVSPIYWDRLFAFMEKTLLRRADSHTAVGLKLQKLSYLLRQSDPLAMYQEVISYWSEPASLVLQTHHQSDGFTGKAALQNADDFIHKVMYWDQMYYLPDDNLAKVDRASMAVGLETRLPLLDHRIVEFAWRVPLSMKIVGGKTKWLLRQVLQKYVPATLFERPKMGFSVPVGEWLRGPLRDWAEELLSPTRLSEEGFFDVPSVQQRWYEHVTGRKNWQLALWSVLMFQAWYRASKSDWGEATAGRKSSFSN